MEGNASVKRLAGFLFLAALTASVPGCHDHLEETLERRVVAEDVAAENASPAGAADGADLTGQAADQMYEFDDELVEVEFADKGSQPADGLSESPVQGLSGPSGTAPFPRKPGSVSRYTRTPFGNFLLQPEAGERRELEHRIRRRGLGGGDAGGFTPARPAEPTTEEAENGVDADLLAALGSGEELWIIERRVAAYVRPPREDDRPGSGALVTRVDAVEVPVPLEHTDVEAQVSGHVASVKVRQRFKNPYAGKIEAVYVFPLPANAAVHDFLMVIGERRIRGVIRERAAAERLYAEARRHGHVASLLTEERPNIFTQKVANIEPGHAIDIEIHYTNTLAYRDGSYEFVFPMVVGPRFNPPCSSDGVGAVAHGAPGISGQSTEVQYLRPGERSGHDIALSVAIDAGVEIETLASPTHVIETARGGGGGGRSLATVRLGRLDTVPNRDFVLRYQVAGERIKTRVLTHRDARGGFFSFLLFPPAELTALERAPVELVFVLDCSGSMSGAPLAKAKAAVERALRRLGPSDTFQIIRFSSSSSSLGPRPLVATAANVERGLAYLRGLESSGGTMMIEGIRAALDFPHDPERLRFVSFMTDGYIGNERQIFAEIHRRLGASRIFSFGVGSSVNRYLLEGMARLGRGAVAYVGLDESATDAVDLFYERIRHPALTDLSIDWGGMEVDSVYPTRLPDLFVGRPIVVTGRFRGEGSAAVRVRGRVAREEREIVLAVDLDDAGSRHDGLARIWARTRIADLADRLATAEDPPLAAELRHELQQVALEFGLVSADTAFVAVDSTRVTAGAHGTTLGVPVPVPAGVKYETTVAGQ